MGLGTMCDLSNNASFNDF